MAHGQRASDPNRSASGRAGFRLVPLTVEAVSALQAILEAAEDYFHRLGARDVPGDMAERLLLAATHTPGRHVMGIEVDARLIGLLDFRLRYPDPDHAYLGLILLVPSERGKGYGSLALDIWETWLALQTPVRRVRTGVPAALRRPLRFFQRRGYWPTGEARRVVVGDRQPRVLILEKRLGTTAGAPETDHS